MPLNGTVENGEDDKFCVFYHKKGLTDFKAVTMMAFAFVAESGVIVQHVSCFVFGAFDSGLSHPWDFCGVTLQVFLLPPS